MNTHIFFFSKTKVTITISNLKFGVGNNTKYANNKNKAITNFNGQAENFNSENLVIQNWCHVVNLRHATQYAHKCEKTKKGMYPVLWITCPRVATATSLLLTEPPSKRASTTRGISSGRYCLIAKPPYHAEINHHKSEVLVGPFVTRQDWTNLNLCKSRGAKMNQTSHDRERHTTLASSPTVASTPAASTILAIGPVPSQSLATSAW